MNYFRIDMRCLVTNEGTCAENPNGTHTAGRHIFMQADSKENAMERATKYFKHEANTKILHVTQIMPDDYVINNLVHIP